MLEGTKLLKDLNKWARPETSYIPSPSTRFVVLQLPWGACSLLLYPIFSALLTPRPASLSGLLRALRSVVTTPSLPLSHCLHFPHHRTKRWSIQGVEVAWDWAALGMAEQTTIPVLPVLRDVHTCRALWLTSAPHFPQQSVFPASLGRTSVGTVPVSLPFQSLAFLNLI